MMTLRDSCEALKAHAAEISMLPTKVAERNIFIMKASDCPEPAARAKNAGPAGKSKIEHRGDSAEIPPSSP